VRDQPGDDVVVVDASVIVDLLAGQERAAAAEAALSDVRMVAPGHLDAEVLSALGRLQRAGILTARQVTKRLADCADAPIDRHAVRDLMAGAWRRREDFRLTDALYVELAEQMDVPLVTSDRRLGRRYPATLVVEG
jgi:predicted nucleic acid-binding protein